MSQFTFRIASPCTQKWDSMKGDERVRHCGACQKNVYDFTALGRTEIETLLLKTEGKVCARLYQRPDGTVVPNDCPVGLAKARRKAMAAMMVFAALALGVFQLLALTKSVSRGVTFSTAKARAIELENELRSVKYIGAVIEAIDPAPKPMPKLMGGLG